MSIPTCDPKMVEPSSIKADLDRIQDEIPKFKPWMSSEACKYWDCFMNEELGSFFKPPPLVPTWTLNSISPLSSIENPAINLSSEQNPELSAMFAAEQATCQVILNQFYNGPKFRNYH